MQQYHGLVGALAERGTDFVFAPMVRDIRRIGPERAAQLCPIVQGSPDVVRWDLGAAVAGRMLSPVIDVGPGPLDSVALRESCRRLAALVGAGGGDFEAALGRAREAQLAFDDRLLEIGRGALDAAARAGVVPVVVLGRTYTIHDDVLNSNVPAILRDQGAIAIPTDCYPVGDDAPMFENMYWGHGQRILRAAWQVRRTPGVYALFASNYSCGPDSFTSHFIQDLMDGKPFSVIETDGHAGDAGTRTRVEAFLHCVREHLATGERARPRAPERLTVRSATLHDVRDAGEQVLVPAMGDGAAVVAGALRGCGLRAEALPEPGADALRLGRRHTSGKECLPMTLTLGSLLERLERSRPDERFAFFMPGTDGPCRFGVYKELHQLVLERLGYRSQVRIWSPPFGDYFQGVPPGLGAIVLTAMTAVDVLRDALYDVRPGEPRPGAAEAIHRDALARIVERVEAATRGSLSLSRVLREAAAGSLWGFPAIVRESAAELARARGAHELPRVLVVGEIYVRNVPSSNGFAVEALERRGLRARVAPITEFLHYSDYIGAKIRGGASLGVAINRFVRWRVETVCHGAAARPLGWARPARVRQVVRAAAPWVNEALEGETVLTVGAAVHAAVAGEIDGILSLGPLECMPNKLAETQLAHVGEKLGIPALTLSLNGDPVDPEPLDGFALEVKERFRARRPPPPAAPAADPSAAPAGAWPETP
jgi:predicted nucleotide-binding protein (sugar kinase/HSP70/actin superfamily)